VNVLLNGLRSTNLTLCQSAFCSVFHCETQEGTACGRKWDVEVMVCENEPLGMSKWCSFHGNSELLHSKKCDPSNVDLVSELGFQLQNSAF
jgi:hypothetical protein